MKILISWLILAISIFLTSYVLPGIKVPGFGAALIIALVFGIVNAILRPILVVLTLPINILTLGLFTLVINAAMVFLTAAIVPEFKVNGFFWALAFSIVVSLINSFLGKLVK